MKYFVLPDEDLRLTPSSRSALRGSFVELSDGFTHYELGGPESGDIVVLVGGLTVPLFYWDRLARMLHEAGLQTLTYSTYGRGYSDRIKGRYDEALFVRQLHELVASLALAGKYHVVGASMGALIAMGHTLQHSSSVATLTVAGPAGLSEIPAALPWLQSSDWFGHFFAKHFGRKWLRRHENDDLEDTTHAAELAAMLRDAFRYEGSVHAIFDTLQHFRLFGCSDLYRSVGDLRIPTMLIWGKEDRVTPISKIDDARTLLRPAQCHVIECGHMVPFERSRVVSDKIVSFMGARENRTAS